jgi:biotin-dependent carboxylase-like uncharacterized protein
MSSPDAAGVDVVRAGLRTCVPDDPGRVGYWNLGIPPSGPMDSFAFRLANLLVGNASGAAGLEAQFFGPALRFRRDTRVAVTGADMAATLDGIPISPWASTIAKAGQILDLTYVRSGARTYVAFDGGIVTEATMSSRSTFDKAGIGGVAGGALADGMWLPLGEGTSLPERRRVRDELIPAYPRSWEVEVTAGPHDDWLDDTGRKTFLAASWRLSVQSDRTGCRLDGPAISFSRKATEKSPENGSDPTNVINYGYPIGAINLCGRTPIVLPVDGPSEGGFITPFTVASGALWRIGQARPGDVVVFKLVPIGEAVALRESLDRAASLASIVSSAR